ncbi:carbohydrate ABC transporter permease [Paenibacillus sp. OK003]|uniref:carbohydrate ABC transporter permease n=1 Tax=Paenibacillus sp. OK003 TaxID=1884380 RepID=UPI0008CA39D1|nr:carbohydrate ABC transporter permease [Paenibacillus sp. OK003]SEL55657.1 putative aldouronate transport system permease protein [Paenibacillus sp. OK003]
MKSRDPLAVSRRSASIIHAMFIFYAIACIVPILLVFAISFSDETTVIANGYKLIPEKFSLTAYDFLFKDMDQIIHSYGISIIVTVIGTITSVALTALYAYPLSRRDLPYRGWFAFFIFFTMLFNGGLVPWYLVYVNVLDLKNSILALIMPLLLSPFFVLVMRTFFANSIPLSILESARIDGAGELRTFTRIVLPLSLPVMATVALFSTLNYWNDWYLSMIFISDNRTISLQYLMYRTLLDIQYLTSNSNVSSQISSQGILLNLPNKTLQMAMAVVGIGPIVLAYPFFQRYFIKGLTVGAVKG